MPALLRFSASLRNILGGEAELTVEAGLSVRDALLAKQIKPELIALVSVNGEMQNKDYIIQEGDVIRLLAVVGGG
jgi:sulfur carrier protein ThiS